MTTPENTATAGARGPGRSARDDERGPECDHWIGAERRHCKDVAGVRRFLPGFRCPAHTPRALQDLPEFPPGPGWPIFRQEAS